MRIHLKAPRLVSALGARPRAGALTLAAIAAAEKPITVKAGNLVLTFNGGVTPKALSKTTMEPITLNVSGKIGTADGTHPPAINEVVIDTDKNGTIDVSGVPTCKAGPARSPDLRQRRKDLQAGDPRHRHHRRRGPLPRIEPRSRSRAS